jgi:hypothetical protein
MTVNCRSTIALVLIVVSLAYSACANTDQALVKCIYFTTRSSFTDDGSSEEYARLWKKWVRQFRLIEKMPTLRKQLKQRPAHYYTGRGRSIEWLQERLPEERVREQPSHIYTLQLGVYDSQWGIKRFMKYYWPKVSDLAIYAQTRKQFYIGAGPESEGKADPLYVLPETFQEHPSFRLYYGLYVSREDARRDAVQLRKHLSYSPLIKQRFLTGRLAHSVIFERVANQIPGGGGSAKFNPGW